MFKKILLLLVTVSIVYACSNAIAQTADDDMKYFVKKNGNELALNGKKFYFNAANNDHLYHWSHFMIDDVLQDANGLGLSVFRTWGSSEGQNSFIDGYCFQPEPRKYDERTFQQMDYIITKAKEKNLRLVIPLVNNWDDGFGGMPQYVKWAIGNIKDWSTKTTLTFDLYNAGDAQEADVAIRTGAQWVWHESLPVKLKTGWNYNISCALKAKTWKTEASGWKYTSAIANLNDVQAIDIGIFAYSKPSVAHIDNIRIDGQVFDGLETKSTWRAADYSYAKSVEISKENVTEGKHSLKVTYSYSVGEYNKAFASKELQFEKDLFYTNAACKQLYKDYIKFFLNRINSISGVAYKNEPAILAWELANEPRCETDPSGDTLQGWIEEISAYIKSIDKNHLVTTGEEGYYKVSGSTDWKYDGSLGTDFIRNHSSKDIDLCSFHLYPEGYGMSDAECLEWIRKHTTDALNVIKKPVFLGEFGITADRKATMLNDFSAGIQGWSIDWNYTNGPVYDGNISRDAKGSIYFTAAINSAKTSCAGRIVYDGAGANYSKYDYISGWVYLPQGAPADLTAEMYIQAGDTWKWASGANSSLAPGKWVQVKLTKAEIEKWGADITKIHGLGIQIKRGATNYAGKVYYDSIGGNLKDIYNAAYQMARRNKLYADWLNTLDSQNAQGAAFWQLLAHRDDGSLFPDYWNWGVYYPEDKETSDIIKKFSEAMKKKCIPVPVNHIPEFKLISYPKVADHAVPVSFAVSAVDADGDQLKLENISVVNGSSSFTVGPTVYLPDKTSSIQGTFRWTPYYPKPGIYTVVLRFKAIDSHGAYTVSPRLIVTVRNTNQLPTITYLRNILNILLYWRGYDKEDDEKLNYYYKVDQGSWTGPSARTCLTVCELKKQFKLKRGTHTFELKARDSKGAESIVKKIGFYSL